MRKSVVAVIVQDTHVLVAKKVKSEKFLSDSWHLPGGGILEGETPDMALRREMMEEVGLDVMIEQLLDESVFPDLDATVRWYLCLPRSLSVRPGSDLVEAKFVPIAEVAKICSPEAVSRWPKGVQDYFKSFK